MDLLLFETPESCVVAYEAIGLPLRAAITKHVKHGYQLVKAQAVA
jgi:hypothetical protein